MNEGDETAPERLMPLVYDDLRRLAHGYFINERKDHTLQATALVHEAYIRLVNWENVLWQKFADIEKTQSNYKRALEILNKLKDQNKLPKYDQKLIDEMQAALEKL